MSRRLQDLALLEKYGIGPEPGWDAAHGEWSEWSDERDVVMVRMHDDGMTYKAIAAAFAVSTSTATGRIKRARDRASGSHNGLTWEDVEMLRSACGHDRRERMWDVAERIAATLPGSVFYDGRYYRNRDDPEFVAIRPRRYWPANEL